MNKQDIIQHREKTQEEFSKEVINGFENNAETKEEAIKYLDEFEMQTEGENRSYEAGFIEGINSALQLVSSDKEKEELAFKIVDKILDATSNDDVTRSERADLAMLEVFDLL